MKVRLFKPSLGNEELDNIKDAFDRSWIGLGPKVKAFEQEWCRYIGCKAAVAVNSATAALHLAVMAFGFPPGKKVLVPVITFASTAFAPLYNQLEPVFVDVDTDTLSISIDDLERKYTSDCMAVIPVHFGGYPAPMEQIVDFARAKNLKVIEDCAHVAGANYRGKKLGTWGDIGCFSFEEKKAMTTGDGGMLCSDDVRLLEGIQPARWVGIDKDTWKRNAGYTDAENLDTRHWYYEIAMLGFKYNMNDLSAAIGLAQLKKLDQMNRRRREIVGCYMEGIKDLKRLRPLLPYAPEENHYWIFGVRCENRDALIRFLKSKEVATGVHYMPLTRHPFFKPYASECPCAERIWESFVTLPLHADLRDAEVDYVVAALQDFDQKSA